MTTNFRTSAAALLTAAAIATIAALVMLTAGSSTSSAQAAEPLIIEAESFVRYNDLAPSADDNVGTARYRTDTAVDIWRTYNRDSAGYETNNYTVGQTRAGEWTDYEFSVAEAGTYGVALRIASNYPSPGSIVVTIDGDDVGETTDAFTGDWWKWQTPTIGSASLAAGDHTMRVAWTGNGNVNFDRALLTFEGVTPPPSCGELTQQAEDAVAIEGGANDLQVYEGDAIGGSYLGSPNQGVRKSAANLSWADYCVTVTEAGTYRIDATVRAETNRDDSFWVSIDGTGNAQWNTGFADGWVNRRVRNFATPVIWQLDAGDHTVRFSMREDGTDLDQFALVPTSGSPTDLGGDGPLPPTPTPPAERTPAADNVLPGRLEAEAFDFGTPDNPAYNDDGAKDGVADQRPEAFVDIYANKNPTVGYTIGKTRGGEWLEYTTFPDQAGTYRVTARVNTGFSTPGELAVAVAGTNLTSGPIPSDGWWNWQIVDFGTVELDANPAQIVRLSWLDAGQINVDWIDFALVGDEPTPTPVTPDPVTPEPSGPQSPYNPQNDDAPHQVPGRIEAENYDRGASGVAWFDTEVENRGNSDFRNDNGVDVAAAIDPNGRNVGFIEDGEWMEYTFTSDTDLYSIFARVASDRANPGRLLVTIDGVEVADFDVANTGGWQQWVTLPYGGVDLTEGEHVMRLTATDGGGFNLNWMRFNRANGQSAFRTVELPARIELEDFDLGNNSVAYHETDTPNLGDSYRWSPVDQYVTDDINGGYHLGSTGGGEWTEYTLSNPVPGAFDLYLRARSATGQPEPVQVEFFDPTCEALGLPCSTPATVMVPTEWTTIPIDYYIDAGENKSLRITTPEGSVDLNWIDLARYDQRPNEPTILPALSGTVDVFPADNLGEMVNRAAPNTTFILKAGVHLGDHAIPKDGQKFLGERNAAGEIISILDGNEINTPVFSGEADGVEIADLEIRNYGTGLFIGAIAGRNNYNFAEEGTNWTVRNNSIHDNYSVGVDMSSGMQVLDNDIFENGQIGISAVGRDVSRLPGIKVERNHIFGNGTENPDAFGFNHHEGGIKTTFTDGIEVRDNLIENNFGIGLYCDLFCDGLLYEDNQILNNIGLPNRNAGGIFVEWATNATVRNNVISTNDVVLEGVDVIGIRIAETQTASVTGNEITMGRGFGLQVRSCCEINDDPSRVREPSSDVTMSGNTVTGTSSVATRVPVNAVGATFTNNTFVGNVQLS